MILAIALDAITHTADVPFNVRTDSSSKICIYSGDPDRGASRIRGSKLSLIAKIRALEILRHVRAFGSGLVEDIGTAADGGIVMEFANSSGRELMIAIGVSGGWTYFSAAVDGRQVKAGILRDDGLVPAARWIAGSSDELASPGVITG